MSPRGVLSREPLPPAPTTHPQQLDHPVHSPAHVVGGWWGVRRRTSCPVTPAVPAGLCSQNPFTSGFSTPKARKKEPTSCRRAATALLGESLFCQHLCPLGLHSWVGRSTPGRGAVECRASSVAISDTTAPIPVPSLQRPGASSPRRKPDPLLPKGPGNLLLSFLPSSQRQACPHASFTSVLF